MTLLVRAKYMKNGDEMGWVGTGTGAVLMEEGDSLTAC